LSLAAGFHPDPWGAYSVPQTPSWLSGVGKGGVGKGKEEEGTKESGEKKGVWGGEAGKGITSAAYRKR